MDNNKKDRKKKKKKPSLFPITWDSACTHTLGVLVGYKLPLKITRCSAVADAEHDAFFFVFFYTAVTVILIFQSRRGLATLN